MGRSRYKCAGLLVWRLSIRWCYLYKHTLFSRHTIFLFCFLFAVIYIIIIYAWTLNIYERTPYTPHAYISLLLNPVFLTMERWNRCVLSHVQCLVLLSIDWQRLFKMKMLIHSLEVVVAIYRNSSPFSFQFFVFKPKGFRLWIFYFFRAWIVVLWNVYISCAKYVSSMPNRMKDSDITVHRTQLNHWINGKKGPIDRSHDPWLNLWWDLFWNVFFSFVHVSTKLIRVFMSCRM